MFTVLYLQTHGPAPGVHFIMMQHTPDMHMSNDFQLMRTILRIREFQGTPGLPDAAYSVHAQLFW
jgi:hypothetical protein